MSTHIGSCVVCGNETACCEDEHVLGAGLGSSCDDGEGGPAIEFCSAGCFVWLEASMADRRKMAAELYPDMLPAQIVKDD